MENILLIGFKSAGKSSVGEALAALLGLPFVDTDRVVEALYCERRGDRLNCREIYARLGAEAMRALETEALRTTAMGGPAVIATGGGAVLHQDNRQVIKDAGFCVFLDTPLPVLEERLAGQLDSPLFRHKSVAQAHGERYRLYSQAADLRITPHDGERPEDLARRVASALKEAAHG